MKKVISLLLALVMCLSMCACGVNNTETSNNSQNKKYVGIYENEYSVGSFAVFYTVSLELLPDGTGTYTGIATKVDASQCTIGLEEGDVVRKGTVDWEVSDDYIVIHYSITLNLTKKLLGKWSTTTQEPESWTETYELKGSKLINVTRASDTWDKVQ